jgi:sugar phosphate isomerase/epimerase
MSTQRLSRLRRSSALVTSASLVIWPTTSTAWTTCESPSKFCWHSRKSFDMKVHVENEGVCNIAGFAELEALITMYRHPRLRALPDIANAYQSSQPPSAADLARLLPFTDILHIKDYSNAASRFVAVGEGDIPIATLLAATLPTREAPLTLTIETHASSEPVATTRRSVSGLRHMIDRITLA